MPANAQKFFGRVYTLNVNGTQVTDLRVQFSIKKTTDKEPNSADIRVFNLAKTTRAKLQGRGVPVILSAGYGTQQGVIFSGDSRTIDHEHDGPDVITRIQCGDGERLYQFARFSKSYNPGTQANDIIRDCVSALSVNKGNLEDALAQAQPRLYLTGYATHGRAVDTLDHQLRTSGFTWSIQQGELQVMKGGKPINPTAVLLSPKTGLVGSPQYASPEKKGGPSTLKVKALLMNQLRCGHVIAVQSDGINAQFRIEKLNFDGDTHGQQWYSVIEAKPL